MYSVLLVFAGLFVAWFLIFFGFDVDDAGQNGGSGGGGGDKATTDRRDTQQTSSFPQQRRRRQIAADLRALITPQTRHSSLIESVDCGTETRVCATNADCATMCNAYRDITFQCDAGAHVCQPVDLDVRTPGAPPTTACNVARGEYAMLVGYTSLGVALWQCVQLYKQFRGGKFCEGGHFDMDARVREPSYRDCRCPPNTRRMVKRIADQYDTSLPHCVNRNDSLFVSDDMVEV